MTQFTHASYAPIRSRSNRVVRTIERMSTVGLAALIMGVFGLTTTVHAAEPSMQAQLEALKQQLEQQQRMMQQQQQMIQRMQHQLDEQKMASEQQLRESEQVRQQVEKKAAKAETIARKADADVKKVAEVVGIDVSKETDRFGKSQGEHFRIPETDTVLTISGFIRGSAIHDFDEIESPTKFATRHIVVDDQSGSEPDNRTTLTANASRFILGSTTPIGTGKLSTFFSWDFNGNTTSSTQNLRLRQAWLQLDGFLFEGDLRVGQAWSTWDDVDALPETVDFQGPNGSQQNRQPLVRWSRDLNDQYKLRVALENPDFDITNGGTKSAWPDTVVVLKWHGDWGHLRPAVVGRQIWGDDPSGGSDTAIGWGTQVAGIINTPLLAEKDNFKFQVVYGKGIGHFNNDGGFDDALFNDGGNLKTIDSFQGYGAYQHWWRPDLRSSAVFGWVDVDNRSQQSDDSLDRTLYAAANLVWSPFDKVDMGVEYLWGERKNKNNADGRSTRMQAMTKVKF